MRKVVGDLVLDEREATEALSALERLLTAVEAGRLQCSPTQRERLRGAAQTLQHLLSPGASTN